MKKTVLSLAVTVLLSAAIAGTASAQDYFPAPPATPDQPATARTLPGRDVPDIPEPGSQLPPPSNPFLDGPVDRQELQPLDPTTEAPAEWDEQPTDSASLPTPSFEDLPVEGEGENEGEGPIGTFDSTPTEAPPSETAEPIENAVAEFTGIDKITGRTHTFDVYIDETVQFGALLVTPRVCISRPEASEQQTNSFIEVDEMTLDRKVRRIFSGWMFAESPGLNAVEHAVYDVWLKSCKQESEVPPPES